MTDRELMQQALDALEHLQTDIEWQYKSPTRTMLRKVEKALRARLAQPEPEPVAWGVPNTRPTEKARFMMLLHSLDGCQYPEQLVPLYTTPPQREWQGLTDEEILEEYRQSYGDDGNLTDVYFARAIESKLKEKNT
jgi:hypothetical protein